NLRSESPPYELVRVRLSLDTKLDRTILTPNQPPSEELLREAPMSVDEEVREAPSDAAAKTSRRSLLKLGGGAVLGAGVWALAACEQTSSNPGTTASAAGETARRSPARREARKSSPGSSGFRSQPSRRSRALLTPSTTWQAAALTRRCCRSSTSNRPCRRIRPCSCLPARRCGSTPTRT